MAGLTLVGGTIYMNNEVNKLLKEVPEAQTSVLTGFNSLEVTSANSNELQAKTFYAEDEIPMHETLQPTTVGNYMQYQKHYGFIQPTETARVVQGSFNQ